MRIERMLGGDARTPLYRDKAGITNLLKTEYAFRNGFVPLAGMAQWIECQPANQRVTGSIPSLEHIPGFGPGPSGGHARGNHTLMFLSLSFSFPSLKINNFFKNLKKRKKWFCSNWAIT